MASAAAAAAVVSPTIQHNAGGISARGLAQELASWYLDQIDPLQPHASNVEEYLRGPLTVLTASVLSSSLSKQTSNSNDNNTTTDAAMTPDEHPLNAKAKSISDWNKYFVSDSTKNTTAVQDRKRLSPRAVARLDAFLEGVALAVISEKPVSIIMPEKLPASRMNSNSKSAYIRSTSADSFGLVEGLVGFSGLRLGGGGNRSAAAVPTREPPQKQTTGGSTGSGGTTNSSTKLTHCPQISKNDLVTRLELYIRCLHRVVAQHHDCVVALEPAKALRARTRLLVRAFVDTVGTVQKVSPVLSRLLTALTRELLAVEAPLSEHLTRVVRRIVSDYVHTTSFASLAFLSSPETSADPRLTPVILQYLLYLQKNWQHCERECEVERFLTTALDREMRHTFKTAEFHSIGHLLEVCSSFRQELQNIELAPAKNNSNNNNSNISANGAPEPSASGEEGKLNQAVLDLQREVISVNGSVLPTVTNRSDLIELLASALNTRTVFEGGRNNGGGGRNSSKKKKKKRRSSSTRAVTTTSGEDEESDMTLGFSSPGDAGYHSGSSNNMNGSGENPLRTTKTPDDPKTPGQQPQPSRPRRRSTFRLSTVDFLTKRLLLAASRTGTGGDAFFVVRDLFGGDDVVVVPSKQYPYTVRPATIDLLVRLASVTIKCHASFDVYPKSLVGDCEPLIQIHTTTTETIALQEVRAPDQQQQQQSPDSPQTTSTTITGAAGPVMVLQERQTETSGKRILSIKPALYEKVEVWNTPS